MDAKTLKALRGSIAKWQAIVNGTGEDMGINNCPLCKLFHRDGCIGCPVMNKTGYPYCSKTPYDTFEILDPDSPEKKAASVVELEFLKSLLPSGEDNSTKTHREERR